MVREGFVAEGLPIAMRLFGAIDWQWTAGYHLAHVEEHALLGGFERVLGMPFLDDFDVLFEIQEGRIGLRRARH
jgi:hypothetical protein